MCWYAVEELGICEVERRGIYTKFGPPWEEISIGQCKGSVRRSMQGVDAQAEADHIVCTAQ